MRRSHPSVRVTVDQEQLRTMWAAGVLIEEMAARLHISYNTVRRRVADLGLPPREQRQKRIIDIDEAVRMSAEGMSQTRIAAHFGVTPSAVFHALTKVRHRESRAASRKRPPSAPPPAPAIDRAPPHPYWTPERDLSVYATAGRHAALSALAAALGKRIAFVQQRWHQLRVMG